MDVFRQIFDWLGNALNDVLGWVLCVLPDSPFKALSNSLLLIIYLHLIILLMLHLSLIHLQLGFLP